MSVTLKLADSDAKLVAKVLDAVGIGLNDALHLVSAPEERNESARYVTVGRRTFSSVANVGNAQNELRRIAAAFDTAARANERGR